MQPVTLNVMRHHRRTIWLHWLTLVLVAFQSVCAKGEPRMIAHSVDISVGFGFLAVIVSRVLWRISGGSRLPPADRRRALHLAVGSVHSGLYLLLAVTLALGALTARGRGDSLFGLFSLPMMRSHHPGLGHQMWGIHGTMVNLVLILASLHAAAVLGHSAVWRDRVLARMLPFLTLSPRQRNTAPASPLPPVTMISGSARRSACLLYMPSRRVRLL